MAMNFKILSTEKDSFSKIILVNYNDLKLLFSLNSYIFLQNSYLQKLYPQILHFMNLLKNFSFLVLQSKNVLFLKFNFLFVFKPKTLSHKSLVCIYLFA
ncbi:hypothetical protein LEP1GSC172_4133 [Leptospira noguchii]|uniref:Uncharacterized protein n=1 Tax=Leptospira noguchii TaxID=28182 RepID=M6VB47_9LEPT|nr:hypothetical protein LEP1GSC172_4133 [Leptospira noguchii]